MRMNFTLKPLHCFQFLLFLLLSSVSHAGDGIIPQHPVSKLYFEENKNQWPSQVKYQADIPGGSLFFEKSTLTFLQEENVDFHGFHDPGKANLPLTVRFHSYKVNFENSNPGVQIVGTDPSTFVKNYYRGNDPSKWAENVNVFEGVRYENMYSNIDIKFF